MKKLFIYFLSRRNSKPWQKILTCAVRNWDVVSNPRSWGGLQSCNQQQKRCKKHAVESITDENIQEIMDLAVMLGTAKSQDRSIVKSETILWRWAKIFKPNHTKYLFSERTGKWACAYNCNKIAPTKCEYTYWHIIHYHQTTTRYFYDLCFKHSSTCRVVASDGKEGWSKWVNICL